MASTNNQDTNTDKTIGVSRRDFLNSTLAASAAASSLAWLGGCASTGRRAQSSPFFPPYTGESELIRVGVIGCGGRGTGAAVNCIESSPEVAIVAMGDLFQDHLDSSRESLTERLAEYKNAFRVTDDTSFVGFDAYKKVLACDVDLVILAAPPHFRPEHLAAAINAGKHVFMEKPVAVDPTGIRSVIESSKSASTKGLGIVAGTQRRHDPAYVETMNRVLDGAIGEVVGGQCYWNQGELWVKDREESWSDMEWQCRNWLYFTWLSGDHIVEQHVHNLDVINWAMGGPPVKAVGMGGRQSRTDPKFGNVFDHFAIEYEYASGARVMSMCRQAQGASHRVTERLVGTKGTCSPKGTIEGRRPFKFEVPEGQEAVNPYIQEHKDLIASIRHGQPLNEGVRIAESTMTAIMGRISAYTGREVSWDWLMKKSELDLAPPAYAFTDLEVRPVSIPGVTKLA